MTKHTKPATLSPHAALLARMETFIGGYMALPDPAWATLLALWAIGTWTYRSFDAFPYLVITAATKQSGKTRLMELLSFLCDHAHSFTALTPAVLFRLLGEARDAGHGATILFDEAETLSKEAASTMRQVMNAGYRRGQSIPRVVKNQVVEFPVYSPKVFVLIGDVYDTLRDRSIVMTLQRGTPTRRFDWQTAHAEAMALRPQLANLAPYRGDIVTLDTFVGGRESEIWAPIFSLASVWCPEKVDALLAVASDLAAAKTAPKRRYSDSADAEQDAKEASYAERALRDMASIIDDKRYVLSSVAVDALRAIPAGPWRVYRGDGLTPILLSNLLSRFGVRPKQFKVAGKVARGYAKEDIGSAAASIAGDVYEIK